MTRSPWPVFWVATLGTFLAYLDVTIVNIAFPDITGDFDDAGLGALSWVVNGYALAFAALLVVLGYSRLLWLQFFARQTLEALFSGLEAAFAYFGGVPQELLFDQMRSW